jgi:mxaA protein
MSIVVFSNETLADVNDESGDIRIVQQSLGRDFGVLVGDQINHHYIIEVPEKFSLSPASLPAKGDLNYWLKIVGINYQELAVIDNHKRYQIDIIFQTFYAPLDVRVLYTPAIDISFHKADDEINLILPKWPFSMSPLKESSAAGGQARAFMKPDLVVKAIETQALKMQIGGLTVVVFILFIVWLVLTGRLFNAARSPFQQAERQIKPLQKKGDVNNIKHAINLVHKAFNKQAGYVVFSHQIDGFLAIFPEFNNNKKQIISFYALSTEVLYGRQSANKQHLQQLLQLCQGMAKTEKLALKK